jgi:hypothetical protein
LHVIAAFDGVTHAHEVSTTHHSCVPSPRWGAGPHHAAHCARGDTDLSVRCESFDFPAVSASRETNRAVAKVRNPHRGHYRIAVTTKRCEGDVPG